MDIWDQATEQEEQHRNLSIKQARAKNQPIAFSGRCLSCNAEIETGRFCPGGECKEQYELEQKIAHIKGFR
jgi:hypothetical protein